MQKTSSPLLCLLLVCGVMVVQPANAAAKPEAKTYARIGEAQPSTHFAKAIEDLPLMDGLELVSEDDVVFIFGSNRIAQTTAKGWVDIDVVYYFYQDTLPQLGWNQVNAKLYHRGNETLHVEASSANEDGMTYVKFEVEPN